MVNPALNKHQQRTEATRRKLVKAGMRVFARDGFEAARIEDIAVEAGHTRGAFYANFKTKEDLFFALLEEEGNRRLTELRDILARCPSQESRIRALRDYYLKRAGDRQWVMLMLEFKLYALRHGKIRAKLAATHRHIRSSLNYTFVGDLIPAIRNSGAEGREAVKGMLEVTLSGLVLERAYDPKRISEQQMQQILGRVFDVFMQA
ncbi:MAG TPA: helix-turn-helix domain-containing protein [Bryobacteraceae bacterium]|jgi:AcrR family transcriptional regulator